MKQNLCISIEKQTIKAIDNILEKDSFRNKSHLIECAINKFLGDNDES